MLRLANSEPITAWIRSGVLKYKEAIVNGVEVLSDDHHIGYFAAIHPITSIIDHHMDVHYVMFIAHVRFICHVGKVVRLGMQTRIVEEVEDI